MSLVRARCSQFNDAQLLEETRHLIEKDRAITLEFDSKTFQEKVIEGLLTYSSREDARTIAALQQRNQALKSIKKMLERQGYEVIDVPGVYMKTGKFDVEQFYNYTNGIFSGATAILPDLGIRVWDRYMRGLLEEMGYDVFQLPVARRTLCMKGGIRCTTQTFRRPQK